MLANSCSTIQYFFPEKTHSAHKPRYYEGDILESKSLKEMIENRKRGAASNKKNHIWPIKNDKHEIPYEINKGNLTSKFNLINLSIIYENIKAQKKSW